MATYVILSRVTPGACREPEDFRKVVETVIKRIEKVVKEKIKIVCKRGHPLKGQSRKKQCELNNNTWCLYNRLG